MSDQQSEHTQRFGDLPDGQIRPPFKLERTVDRKAWEKINKKISTELSKLR